MFPGLRITELPKFDSVVAGQFATSTLTKGRKYHVLHIDAYDANFAAIGTIIDTIEVLVNDNPQRAALTPTELNAINSSRSPDLAMVTSGTLGTDLVTSIPIYFAEPDRQTPGAVAAGGWNNNGVDSIQVKVKVKSTASTPVVKIWGEWEPSALPLGKIAKWYKSTPPISADTLELTNLHQSHVGDLIQSMHFLATSDGKYVSTLRARVNGEEVRDTLTVFRNQVSLLGRGMAPDTTSAPRFDFVLDYDDPIIRGLLNQSLRSFDVRAVYNAAPSGGANVITVAVGEPD